MIGGQTGCVERERERPGERGNTPWSSVECHTRITVLGICHGIGYRSTAHCDSHSVSHTNSGLVPESPKLIKALDPLGRDGWVESVSWGWEMILKGVGHFSCSVFSV